MNWFQTRSLPVTPEIIVAVLSNPEVTSEDLEALGASVENLYGYASPWVEIIHDLESDLVLQDYYDYLATLETTRQTSGETWHTGRTSW